MRCDYNPSHLRYDSLDLRRTLASWPNGECKRRNWPYEETYVSGAEFADLPWRKSSASATAECLEVARAADGGVLVRDSKDPSGPVLRFTEPEWTAFVTGVKADEFDVI